MRLHSAMLKLRCETSDETHVCWYRMYLLVCTSLLTIICRQVEAPAMHKISPDILHVSSASL